MAAEDDSDIPDTGAVFTFGKSKFADNLPNKFWVRNDRVRDVACGDEHTALVAESGRVFTFGSNDWGQLGLGHTKTADRPSCIKSLKSERVKLVACGRVHTIVATESGKLYAFGANGENQLGVDDSPSSNVPKCIDSLVTQQYKMLAAGADHSVALTDDGCVFVWGGGSEGQLGLGGKTECPEPEEIPIEDTVICISCGYYHTAFVTDTGELYTFGESEGGKLGLGDDPDDTDTPQKVSIPEKVTAVACGGSHTIALTESGCLYSFGEGASGQLGHGTHCLQISTPRKVNLKFKVSAVFCGENHTSVISEKGQMYTFGDGRHGKLALGQDSFSNVFIPKKVERFQKFCVEKVSCGGCHMIALAKLRQDSEDVYSSDDDIINEPKINGVLNHSLKADGSIDLNNSVTARDRRRKHNDSFKNDLNRTLPALAGAGVQSEHLHMTVPPTTKSRKVEHKISPLAKEEKVEDEQVHEELIQAESSAQVKSSPNLPPRPLPRKQPDPLKHEDEESDEEETEEEEEEEVKEDDLTQSKRALPQAPIPKPRAQPKIPGMSEEDEENPEEKKEGKKKDKKLKKKKTKGVTLFGRKKPALSEDEEAEEEEVEDEEENEIKDIKKTDSAKPLTDEEEEEEEEEDEEEKVKDKKKDKKEKKKDKKKDKKDKKKDKKDKKKGKDEDIEEEEEEEEEEEKEEENDKETKDKKKDKKDTKKDKDKKDKKKDKKKKGKDEEEEEDEEKEEEEEEDGKKKKDKKKDKKDKDKKEDKKDKDKKDKKKKKDKDEKSEDEEEGNDKKTDEDKRKTEDKPAEPPKKKSRTCTIL